MFWVAVGVHGLLLFIPLASEDTIAVPPDEATETISVTRIPSRPSSTGGKSNSGQSTNASAVASSGASAGGQGGGGGGSSSVGTGSRPSIGSRPSAGRANPGGSAGGDRDIDDEIPNLSDDNSDDDNDPTPSTVNTDTQVANTRGNPGGSDTVTTDPLLTYTTDLRNTGQIPEALQAYVRALRLDYLHIPVDSTTVEQEKENWISAIRLQTNRPDLSPEEIGEPITIAYPSITCLHPNPAPAMVGILVDADGKVVPVEIEEPASQTASSETASPSETASQAIANPDVLALAFALPNTAKVIQGTGYRGLDREAIKAVSDQAFSPDDDVRAFLYQVQVDYDADRCFTLTDN